MHRIRHFCPVLILCSLMPTAPLAARTVTSVPPVLEDLYFGEALFHALQDRHFDAVSRLDAELALHHGLDEPERDSLGPHRGEAVLFIGDLELGYRMNRRGGRAMERLLAADVPPAIRHEAAWRLARVSFERADYVHALETLDRIEDLPGGEIGHRLGLLRGQVLLGLGRPEEAADVLGSMSDRGALGGYVAYNHAIALIRSDRHDEGLRLLDRLGRTNANSTTAAALRDRANLALGFALLEADQPARAQAPLERVRLDGPFSSRALLWYGWGDAGRNEYRQALIAWTELRERDPTDPAVQEALLAAPYGYAQLEAYGRAALLYGEAVEIFGQQLDRLQESIRSVREGDFLAALIERDPEPGPDGSLRIQDLPDEAPTRYLADLMAGRGFQQAWLNYRDLNDLLERVEAHERTLPAWRELVEQRRSFYTPLLPVVEAEWAVRDTRLEEVRERLDEARAERERLLTERDPMALATDAEQGTLADIDRLRRALPRDASADEARARLNRLTGIVRWDILTEYPDRLSAFHDHIEALADALDRADEASLTTLKRIESVPLLYEGYGPRFDAYSERLGYLDNRIRGVRAQQGRVIEQMAVDQLIARHERVQQYQTTARFAAAENFDRALSGRRQRDDAEPAGELIEEDAP